MFYNDVDKDISGFDCRDFYGFLVITAVFVSSILLEGFPPISTSMLDMVLFMSSGQNWKIVDAVNRSIDTRMKIIICISTMGKSIVNS